VLKTSSIPTLTRRNCESTVYEIEIMFRTILGIAALVVVNGTVIGFSSEAGQCGVVRGDGSICQKLSGGKSDCEALGGTCDFKKNCCEINNVGG
jgi:hypothetical protein